MKFKRNHYRQIIKEITWGATPRRITAAKRALQNQRDKTPLFAGEIARSQPTPEERIIDFDKWRKRGMKDMRLFAARQWREARHKLRKMDLYDQKRLLEYWNNHWCGPLTSEYFADLVHNWHRHGIKDNHESRLRGSPVHRTS